MKQLIMNLKEGSAYSQATMYIRFVYLLLFAVDEAETGLDSRRDSIFFEGLACELSVAHTIL
jgi:hypothetical protein